MDEIQLDVKKRRELTLKQRQFLQAYFRTGSWKAARKSAGISYSYASVLVNKQFMRDAFNELMDARGLTDGKLCDTLSDALGAEKVFLTEHGENRQPDHYIRLRAVEIAHQMKQPPKGVVVGVQVNNEFLMNSEEIQKRRQRLVMMAKEE